MANDLHDSLLTTGASTMNLNASITSTLSTLATISSDLFDATLTNSNTNYTNSNNTNLQHSVDTANGTLLPVGVENSMIDRDEQLARIEIATLSVIFFVTVLGNTTVLLALWTRRRYAGRKKLSRMYFFILHLSIADLITAFLSDLPQLGWEVTYRFVGGAALCKLVKFGQTLGPYLSSYVLMATAIDRHQAICYPLTYCSWTSRRSKVMVWIAWATSLTFCIPQLTIFSYQEVAPGVFDCWATFPHAWGERMYVTWYGISVFIIPLIVLIVTYSCICHEIWNSSVGEFGLRPRNVSTNSSFTHYKSSLPPKRAPLISRAKINTVKQTIAVIVMYIVCSTPFISAQLWATWDPNAYKSPFLDGPCFTILTLMYSLNSCVNPWIYLTFNRELPRLLIRHYTASNRNNNYTSAAGNSTSNSSGAVESTSLRPFTRWSFCNGNRVKPPGSGGGSGAAMGSGNGVGQPLVTNGRGHYHHPHHPHHRPYVAQYNQRRWIVTTTNT